VAGRRALYRFLEDHRVEHHRCGKLVVATDPGELERLEMLLEQARRNDVEGVVPLTRSQALALESELSCEAALLSAQSGVFDSHGYMLALKAEIEWAGGVVAVRTPFDAATPLDGGGFSERVGGDDPATVTCRLLVAAPGLDAQRVAGGIDGFPPAVIPPARYGKGRYFRLQGRAPFSRLIYPLPVPGALGTHYRRDLGGQGIFGPDLVFVDEPDFRVDASARAAFARDIARFWPAVRDAELAPDYAGVRPKLHGPGEPQPDFRIDGAAVHGIAGLVVLFGIESPGLTSSLAIGDHVAALIGF
jgi:L-2-hydroxyglutarate oxidase LhgO